MPNDFIQRDDEAARQQALDIRESFIVQAPAGSGKTGLLIQRYLALLATVERPEQILAITFTKKAASEMRERVLKALHEARNNPPPKDAFALQTWQSAKKIIQLNQLVTDNSLFAPECIAQRLRIQTIDSLCSELVLRMPLTSRLGNTIAPVENSEPLLREATRRVLAQLEHDTTISDATEILLQHLDNDYATVESLLMRMLARRDQWLRHLTDRDKPDLQREELESGWRELVVDRLIDLRAAIADIDEQELYELARYAASHITKTDSPILACKDLQSFPDTEPEAMTQWQGIAALLLTNEGEWRKPKGININSGFPPSLKAKADAEENKNRESMKKRMHEYVEINAENTLLAQKLHAVRELPAHGYTESQWQVLHALLHLLPDAVTTLRNVFAETGQCDFTEIALGALEALGEPDEPTDLLLALDYRIQHILIDEFQDTSVSQFELLVRLTAGWQIDDGRTLFIVGDPMQSIYRFREADVSLFLGVRELGIGDLRPKSLLLSRNFRSQQGIVDWVNQTFEQVFPSVGDAAGGAIGYVQTAATKPAGSGVAVQIHPLVGNNWKLQQAKRIGEIAAASLQNHPERTIAVLARSRTHLAQIVQAFNQQRIPFTAVEIDALAERQLIIDLSALTRAMLNPADRTAWLSVLRAPWCGLCLADLSALAESETRLTVWQLLNTPTQITNLSQDGMTRVKKFLAVMQISLPQRDRISLRSWIESTWLALGGPAGVASGNELDDATSFFDMLETFSGQDFSMEALDTRLKKLYAQPPQQTKTSVQLMTMHKSKGLEFDIVILPSLSARPRNSDSPLMIWQEYTTSKKQNQLLLAPISGRGMEKDPLYVLAKNLDAQRDKYESQRLLYVATTRAKKQCHIFAQAEQDKDGLSKQPNKATLLYQLWPVVESQFAQAVNEKTTINHDEPSAVAKQDAPYIQRVESAWQLPAIPATIGANTDAHAQVETVGSLPSVEYLWVGDTARHVGTVVHQVLRRIANEGAANWTRDRIETLTSQCRASLLQLGVNATEIDNALPRVMAAIYASTDDAKGRWILDHQHQDSATELAVTALVEQELVNVIIDRTFVDKDGTRWIIDYKSSTHEGADVEKFLDNEVTRYREQLERYRTVMSQLDQRPIKCGLYFPLLRAWREW